MSNNKGAGRPYTDLKPILKQREAILGWFKEGKSIVGVLAMIYTTFDIYLPKSTLYDGLKDVKEGKGTKDQKELSDLIDIGRMLSQEWWEELGRNHIIGTKEEGTLNAGVYNKLISCQFQDDYREQKNEIEVKTPDTDVTIRIGGEDF